MPDLEKAVKKRNFDDKRSAHSTSHFFIGYKGTSVVHEEM